MAFEIPQLYVEQFNSNIRDVAQQTQSRLQGSVLSETQRAEVAWFDETGKLDLKRKTARNAATPLDPAEFKRRASFLRDFDRGVPIYDRSDVIRIISDPTSAITRNLASARNRCRDENIIKIALETAYRRNEERDSLDPVDIPASNKVAVNYVPPGGTPANSGLTLAKLIKMRSILGLSETEELARGAPEITFVHSQRQIDDLLLNVDQVANSRYADVKALIEGKVHHFMGFRFIQTELLPVVAGVRTCFAYTRDTIMETVGENDFSRVSEREDLSYMLQAYTFMSVGGVRLRESTIAVAYCAEA